MKSWIALLVIAVCSGGIAIGDEVSGKQAGPAGIDWDDPGQVIEAVARGSEYWTAPASPDLQTLGYRYLLGHQPREVKLQKGISNVRYSLWQGCSLRTDGCHRQ